MAARRKRVDRKLHRRFLDLGVIDASQDRSWRQRLFAAKLYEPFQIDARHSAGLPRQVARGIRRYRLSYVVSRVPQIETEFADEDWEGCVFFRFQAAHYPEIVSFSANNPRVLE